MKSPLESPSDTLPPASGPAGDPSGVIAGALVRDGYIVLPAALPPAAVDALFLHFESLLDGGAFASAGIGREQAHRVDRLVRGDDIHWLDPAAPPTLAYFRWAEQLRLGLNRRLFLGLFDYECHFAYYPQGAFYRTHRDAFHGDDSRVVSTVLYLNPDWMPQHGGELLLYAPDGETLLQRVEPRYGRLVLFLSEALPHQVLPVDRPRYSLTGWFRRNRSRAGAVDPPA